MLTTNQIKTLAEADGWKYDGSHWGFSKNSQLRRLEDFNFVSGFDAIIRLRQDLGMTIAVGLDTTPEQLAHDTVHQLEKRRSRSSNG